MPTRAPSPVAPGKYMYGSSSSVCCGIPSIRKKLGTSCPGRYRNLSNEFPLARVAGLGSVSSRIACVPVHPSKTFLQLGRLKFHPSRCSTRFPNNSWPTLLLWMFASSELAAAVLSAGVPPVFPIIIGHLTSTNFGFAPGWR